MDAAAPTFIDKDIHRTHVIYYEQASAEKLYSDSLFFAIHNLILKYQARQSPAISHPDRRSTMLQQYISQIAKKAAAIAAAYLIVYFEFIQYIPAFHKSQRCRHPSNR